MAEKRVSVRLVAEGVALRRFMTYDRGAEMACHIELPDA